MAHNWGTAHFEIVAYSNRAICNVSYLYFRKPWKKSMSRSIIRWNHNCSYMKQRCLFDSIEQGIHSRRKIARGKGSSSWWSALSTKWQKEQQTSFVSSLSRLVARVESSDKQFSTLPTPKKRPICSMVKATANSNVRRRDLTKPTDSCVGSNDKYRSSWQSPQHWSGYAAVTVTNRQIFCSSSWPPKIDGLTRRWRK